MFQPTSDWRPPIVSTLPSWEGAKRISLDCETKDPYLIELGCGARRPETFVAGYSFAINGGPKHYVPMRHLGGDNVENPANAIEYLRGQAKAFKGDLVGANINYDLDFLSTKHGIEFNNVAWVRDIQIADPLIYELYDRYSLEAVAERRGLAGKDETLLRAAARYYGLDAKGSLWAMPARFVGAYAEQDAELPLRILEKQEEDITKQELWEVFNLESKLLLVLLKMRQRGIRISETRLEAVERWSLIEETKTLDELFHVSGHRVAVGDTMKPGAVAPALLNVGIQVPKEIGKKGKEAYSIDKDWLKAQNHKAADLVLRARKVAKLRGTFATSIRTHMVNGRVHATFNQLKRTDESDNSRGAKYGRLSCDTPNLQQQPSRGDFAKMWRSIYLPEEGAEFCSADFSQQEPRMMTHYAELCRLDGAWEAAERYRRDPNIDNHTMMTKMIYGDDVINLANFKALREECKIILLARCYGAGGAKTCHQLGLPTRWGILVDRDWKGMQYFGSHAEAYEASKSMRAPKKDVAVIEMAGVEGDRILRLFDEKLPFVRKLAKKCEEEAGRKGYVRTLSGRRCRFPSDGSGGFDWIYKALNRVIQGGSGDQAKRSLVLAHEAGVFLQLQVHDELNFSFWDRAEPFRVAKLMRNAYELRVPFKVDVEAGPSWGECVAMKEAA